MVSLTYTHCDAFGKLQTRADWLKYARGRAGRATQLEFGDVRTRIVEHVAIVTGINDVRGAGARDAGNQSGLSIRFTEVWVWQGRPWLREAFQATPH